MINYQNIYRILLTESTKISTLLFSRTKIFGFMKVKIIILWVQSTLVWPRVQEQKGDSHFDAVFYRRDQTSVQNLPPKQ